jgi:hypothetical protein
MANIRIKDLTELTTEPAVLDTHNLAVDDTTGTRRVQLSILRAALARTAAAGAIAIGDSASAGSAASLARTDHRHSLAAPPAPASVGTANAAGAATTVARSDHVHDAGAIAGTRNLSYEVNSDASAASAESPLHRLLGGDGVSAPNDDVVRYEVELDSVNERVIATLERNRNGGGFSEVAMALHLGTPGRTAAFDADLLLNSGTGAAARQCIIRSDTTGNLDIRYDSAGGLLVRRGGTVKFQVTSSDVVEVSSQLTAAGINNLDLRAGTDPTSLIVLRTGSNERVRITNDGNLGLGQTSFGSSAAKVLAIGNGTAPGSSPADATQLYSADQAAGNACLHTRTEGGAIIKLFQGAALTSADGATVDGTYGAEEAGVINNIRTRLGEIQARLQAHGLIA